MIELDLFNDINLKLEKRSKYLKNKYFIKDVKINEVFISENKRRRPHVEFVVSFEKTIDLLKLVSLESYLSRILSVKATVITDKTLNKNLT